MGYTPTVWSNGDIITAEKLNNIEGGVENCSEIFKVRCTLNEDNYTCTIDKTFSEIVSAILDGRSVVVEVAMQDHMVILPPSVYYNENDNIIGIYFERSFLIIDNDETYASISFNDQSFYISADEYSFVTASSDYTGSGYEAGTTLTYEGQ